MEGFPDDGVLGQTGPGGSEAPVGAPDPQQQQMQAMQAMQNQIIQQFLDRCRGINLIDAASNRGILNRIVTENAERVVASEEFQRVVTKINQERDRGMGRIYLSNAEVEAVDKDLEGKVPSAQVWMSLLTTLGYGVTESSKGDDERRLMISW